MYVNGRSSSGPNNGYDFFYMYSDGGTVQCSIVIRCNGTIEVWRGGLATKLQQWDNAYPPFVWVHWQIKVVVHGTSGEVRIRKNGNPVDDFVLTGVDLTSTANDTCDKISLNCGETAGDSVPHYLDDFIIYDGTGSAPWNDFVGDVRAVQLMPNADTGQINFSPNATTTTIGGLNTGATAAQTANNQIFNEVVPQVGGFLGTSVNVSLNANMTGHLMLGLYDSDGVSGAPGTLLAFSSALTNPTTGINAFTLTSTPELKAGRSYYWSLLGDASYTVRYDTTLANTFRNWVQAQSYGSGLVASAAATAGSSGRTAQINGVITLTNSGCVNNLIQTTLNYVSDSNSGDYDLYEVDDLAITPSAILGATIRGFVAKSDAGSRLAQLTIKSGTTVQDGDAQVLSTTFQNIVMNQDIDPDTGVAWTESGINAIQIGPKVAA